MGIVSDEDRKGLDKSLKDLNLSNEVHETSSCPQIRCGDTETLVSPCTQEADKFAKAFKDPEFIKLFEEYAKEVSDPKASCWDTEHVTGWP